MFFLSYELEELFEASIPHLLPFDPRSNAGSFGFSSFNTIHNVLESIYLSLFLKAMDILVWVGYDNF